MKDPGRKRLGILVPIALLASLLVQACPTQAPTAVPEVRTASVAAIEQPFEIALNPLKTDLNPGEQVVLSAIPSGVEQSVPNLQWFLEPASGYDETYGELSSERGPSVIYTAPRDVFPVSVIVTALREETGQSEQIQFNVAGPLSTFLLRGGGGLLQEEKAQDVLLAALPFKDLLYTVFPDQNVLLAVETPNRWEPDASYLEYDYDWARSEADWIFAGSEVRILVPGGDDRLIDLADLMAKALNDTGISAYSEVVPSEDIAPKMEDSIASGLPVLTLTPQ